MTETSQISDLIARDFHTLTSAEVERLLAEADRVKYRKPKNANGSRARYFHAKLQREKQRSTTTINSGGRDVIFGNWSS